MKYARFNEHGDLVARYDSAIHGAMPASGFTALSDEIFYRSIAETDGVWRLQADGSIEKMPLPIVTPTAEQLIVAERVWRDEEVSASEWLVARHRDEVDMQLPTTLTADSFAQLLAYRRALRDWPQSELFPSVWHRPVAPPWLAEQTQ